MNIIGEKLTNQELLSIKGGIGSCYECSCAAGEGTWLQTSSTATEASWEESCGQNNKGTCEETVNPHCPVTQQ